jgi:hypothetical protein
MDNLLVSATERKAYGWIDSTRLRCGGELHIL